MNTKQTNEKILKEVWRYYNGNAGARTLGEAFSLAISLTSKKYEDEIKHFKHSKEEEKKWKEHYRDKLKQKDEEFLKLIDNVVLDIEQRITLCLIDTNKKKDEGMPQNYIWKSEALGYKTSLECVKRTREKYDIKSFELEQKIAQKKTEMKK